MSTPKITSRPGPKITPNTHYGQDGCPIKDRKICINVPAHINWNEVSILPPSPGEGRKAPSVVIPNAWVYVDEDKEGHHI